MLRQPPRLYRKPKRQLSGADWNLAESAVEEFYLQLSAKQPLEEVDLGDVFKPIVRAYVKPGMLFRGHDENVFSVFGREFGAGFGTPFDSDGALGGGGVDDDRRGVDSLLDGGEREIILCR